MFYTSFNNISFVSLWSVWLVKKLRKTTYLPTSHWKAVSLKVVSSTPLQETGINLTTVVVIGTSYPDRYNPTIIQSRPPFMFVDNDFADGRQKLNKRVYSLEKLEDMYPFMDNEHYIPSCRPYQKIAIVVPYRDREKQLKVFINNVLPRIYRQNQEFGVYLVEQVLYKYIERSILILPLTANLNILSFVCICSRRFLNYLAFQ